MAGAPTLDGMCSQLSRNVDRAGQPALKDILFHLQEKLVSGRETGNRVSHGTTHAPHVRPWHLSSQSPSAAGQQGSGGAAQELTLTVVDQLPLLHSP